MQQQQQQQQEATSISLHSPALNASLRNASLRPPWFRERTSIFKKKKKSKKVKLSMWEHEFICLASCSQAEPPSAMEKAELIRAGLGPRKLSLFEFGESSEFHEDIVSAFPPLSNGGGYELMRTKHKNNHELEVIPPPPGGYTVEYVKNIVCQAKVYVRPIQRNLSLVPQQDISSEKV